MSSELDEAKRLLRLSLYELGYVTGGVAEESTITLRDTISDFLASEKQDQQTPMPCIYCDNGEGDCAFPYYGKAPHNADTHQILPECQWPDNFVSDPENPECGKYTHCLFCMASIKPDDVESLRSKLKEALRENFTLASGQCTEGGPWGDEGGSSYCKYRNKSEPKQDQPEPVAWTSQEQLGYMEDPRYEGCGMYMWKLRGNGVVNIPLYLHPAPRKPFVRLSEDEICEMANEAEVREWSDEIYNFARAIEDALEEKSK